MALSWAKKGTCDLTDPEPTNELQGQRHPGLARDRRMAGEKHHAELVVIERRHLAFQQRLRGHGRRPVFVRFADHDLFVGDDSLMAQAVQGTIAGHSKQPGRRVVRNAAKGPLLKGRQHGVLNRFFGECEVPAPKRAGQRRNHL